LPFNRRRSYYALMDVKLPYGTAGALGGPPS